ncbi:MAG: FG-GAP repeat protein [Planctomycetota bacterium]|nr:FG-GAP repeat protein [Planctomycetota bacterium]
MNPRIAAPASLFALISLASAGGTPEGAPPTLTASTHPASEADLAGLQAAFASARRAAVPTADGFRLDHRASQVRVRLDGRGLDLAGGAPAWGLELAGYGFEGSLQPVAGEPAVRADGNRVTYSWGAALDEWVVNDARGIEHGYTLHQRPTAGQPGAALAFDLDVRGDLSPAVAPGASDVLFLDAAGNAVVSYTGLTVFDAEGRSLPSHFEPRGDELRLEVDDAGAVYPLTIDPMIQLGYLKALDPDYSDRMGDAVAISGNTAVVGVPHDASASTGAYGDEFNNDMTGSGAAYVFVKNGSTWTQQAFLKASNTGSMDRFGYSVAIDGDRIVVGAPFEDGASTGVDGDQGLGGAYDSGAAYVFYRFGLTWGQEAYLKATNTENGDSFGFSVGISGDLIVVGARYEDGGATGINGDASDNSVWRSGAAFVYSRSGFSWSPQLYLKASNPDSNDYFGVSVAIDGTRIAVAASSEGSGSAGINGDQQNEGAPGSGAVYVFEQKGELWVQDAYIKASNPGAWDRFGASLALSGDTLAVGASVEESAATGIDGDQSDNSMPAAGAAYVFVDDGVSWSQEAYLKASNTAGSCYFGNAIDVSGDRVVVGSIFEDSAAVGINGDDQDTSAMFAGAAYSYLRSGGVWSQEAYLKAANAEAQDHFGAAVGVSGDTVIVGAPGEDGGQGGVNGDPTDNSGSGSGAVYAFELSSPWGVAKYGPGTGANTGDLSSYSPPLVNHFVKLEISAGDATGLAFLMISAAPASLPVMGGTLLVDSNLSIFGPGGVAYIPIPVGEGSYTTYVPPLVAGLTVYAQAAMFDKAQPFGLAFTNGLSISVP